MSDNPQQPADEQDPNQPQHPDQQPEPQLDAEQVVVPEELAREVEQSVDDFRYEVLSDLRHRLNLTKEGFQKLNDVMKVNQHDSGMIASVELAGIPEEHLAGLTGLPLVHDKKSGVGQYDVDLIERALRSEMGDSAFRGAPVPHDPFTSVSQPTQQVPNVRTTGDGYQLREGEEGLLFEQATNLKPILVREGADFQTIKAAKELAKREGRQVHVIPAPQNPATLFREGDIRLPPNYAHRDYAEASRVSDVTGRAVCDHNGNVIRSRNDAKFERWKAEVDAKFGGR